MSAEECKYSESYPALCTSTSAHYFKLMLSIFTTHWVQRLLLYKVCYTNLQNLASNLVDEARHNAKGKLIQGIQDATWHTLDIGKFLKEAKDAAFCLSVAKYITQSKRTIQQKSLVI